ncbi:hypothetical protein [Amycolatopsis samaneae]|uniref:ESX-1 secretion-associated protein n=1 Tax=Amycolatopsis samaneae TaxID=664691 RepID=A0ABW5G830_9PSEU
MTTREFDLGGASSGFEVYPDALRKAKSEVFFAADRVISFAGHDLPPLVLKENDVGMLGTKAGIVDVFNSVVDSMRDKSERGAAQLTGLAAALAKAADFYEAQDEEFYKRLRDKETETK